MLAADAALFANPEYNWSWAHSRRDRLLSRFHLSLSTQSRGVLAHHGSVGRSRGQYHLRQILVQLGVHWLVKPEVSS